MNKTIAVAAILAAIAALGVTTSSQANAMWGGWGWHNGWGFHHHFFGFHHPWGGWGWGGWGSGCGSCNNDWDW